MAELKDQIIVYDDVCPLCKAYTAGFVQLGWLEKRSGFTDAPPELLAAIDLERARHEIPLFDARTGQTRYGLDALFFILSERWPVFKPLFRSSLFRWPLRQLYQLITFNRRLIAGSAAPATGFDCAPDVNLFWRGVYGFLAVGGGLLAAWPMLAGGGFWATAALVFQGFLLFLMLFSSKKLDFAGHWATIFLVQMVVWRLLPGGSGWAFLPILLAAFMAFKRRKLVF